MTRMSAASQADTTLRRLPKTNRSGKQGALYSDYYEDESEPVAPQRSISLSALHTGTAPLEPRMAQLETLEAKMASIEVSLSTTPRRKKPVSAATTPTPPTTNHLTTSNHMTTTNHLATTNLFRTSKDVVQELEMLRTTLRDKENVIHSLKGQLCTSLSISRLLQRQATPPPLSDKERRAAEDRLARLRAELDSKRLAIKNIKLALERLDITDNIDVRIQQAELEYQLGREELNLLSVLEESHNLQAALDDNSNNKHSTTLFTYVKDSTAVTLHAVELVYDPKSPRFGAAPRDDGSGLYVEWAAEDSGLVKGDRVVEANGKMVVGRGREELHKLLAVSPDPAQLVVCRRVPPLDTLLACLRTELTVARDQAERVRADNLRLTHRISYLEEQVTELSRPASSADSVKSAQITPASPAEVQVFQKGPQVTALVANLPGLDVGSKSPADSKQTLPTMRVTKSADEEKPGRVKSLEKISSSDTEKLHRKKKDTQLHSARSINSLDAEIATFSKCHKYNINDKSKRVLDYSSESSIQERKSHRRYSENHQAQLEQRQRHLRDARSSLFDLAERDKHNGRLDFDPESSYKRPSSCQLLSKHADTLSQKSLDYSSESSSRYYKKHSDPRTTRPVPPKKPLRLSLHRATSLQSMEANEKKSMKRNHKGENQLWPTAVASIHSATSYHSKTSLAEKWC